MYVMIHYLYEILIEMDTVGAIVKVGFYFS